MVTSVKLACNGNRYSLCTKDGHLKGSFYRNDLVPIKRHTIKIKCVNEIHPGLRRQIIIQDTCNAYANMEHCNCRGNCKTLTDVHVEFQGEDLLLYAMEVEETTSCAVCVMTQLMMNNPSRNALKYSNCRSVTLAIYHEASYI